MEIPKLKRITLNFGYQKSNFKYLVSSLLALEFISSKKGEITISKHLNVFLKIKKGNPVGCKIILRKNTMYFFYIKLMTSIFSKVKQSQTDRFQLNPKTTKSISFQAKKSFIIYRVRKSVSIF